MSSLYLNYLNLKQAISRKCDQVIGRQSSQHRKSDIGEVTSENETVEQSEQEAERPLKKRWKGVRGLDGDVK
jgi:hypothetical protein